MISRFFVGQSLIGQSLIGQSFLRQSFSRRGVLSLGAAMASGVMGGGLLAGDSESSAQDPIWTTIENIIQAQGDFSDGVFRIELDRSSGENVTLHGVPIPPAFQLNGSLFFQKLTGDRVLVNADMPLKPQELLPFIDKLLAGDIVFQAEHQHFYDFAPLFWFIHFRKEGTAADVAHSVKMALGATSMPFPQSSAKNPTTPLPADEMGTIIGAKPKVGADGVVSYHIPRQEPMTLGGVRINPFLNVETHVAFEPVKNSASQAAAATDFGMIASEIDKVIGVMRKQGWDIGCLYNQETAETPQLYFSHHFKTGDPIQLAREFRNGLNLMNVKLKS